MLNDSVRPMSALASRTWLCEAICHRQSQLFDILLSTLLDK